jgi:hypothetical protein
MEIETKGRDPNPIWGRGVNNSLFLCLANFGSERHTYRVFWQSENDYLPIVVGNIYRRRTANNQALKKEIWEGEDEERTMRSLVSIYSLQRDCEGWETDM